MISVKRFIAAAEEIAAEEPGYQLGHSGDDHLCDCIGLVIGAIRRAGGVWRGTHGSNYAARNELVSLKKLTDPAQLRPGELVFKAREPGDEKYALPDKYKSGTDLRDYYHVGVVIWTNPLKIRHMTTPKPTMDYKIGKWGWHGWCRKITDGQEGTKMNETAKVVRTSTAKGDTVKMRSGPGTSCEVTVKVPFGAEITVSEDRGKWCEVAWVDGTGRTWDGWMMSDFIEYGGADGEVSEITLDQLNQIDQALGVIEKCQAETTRQVEIIGSICGRG